MQGVSVNDDYANRIDPAQAFCAIARQLCCSLPLQRIATLGPHGTSSELAAEFLLSNLPREVAGRIGVLLFESFELAEESVLAGQSSLLLVANAYEGINRFYMNSRLRVLDTFIHVTPNYGVASRGPVDTSGSYRLATFPAVVPLIGELLPPLLSVRETVLAKSTSDAARLVAAGEVDLAVTNESSVREHGLRFVSHVRPIRMVWTVFGVAPERAAREERRRSDVAPCSNRGVVR